MTVIGTSRAALTVLGLALGATVLLAAPAAANPDDSSGDGGGSSSCPAGGCVNVYGPEDTGGSKKRSNPPHDSSGSSGDSHGSDTSSGCGSGCGGHSEKTKTKEPEQPEVIVIPRDEKPRPVPVRPRPPAAPVDPGGAFVPADQPPAVVPVLEQNAVSRGAGEVVPAELVSTGGGGEPDDSAPAWPWAIPALAAAAVGGALAFGGAAAGSAAGAGGSAGAGFGGPTSGFTRSALGGAVSAGGAAAGSAAAAKAMPDLRQLAWDWGGHLLGGLTVLVSLNPVSWPGIGAGTVLAVLWEAKRRLGPAKPQTVNDMIGGNPYQRAQQAGNAGIGQTVRDAHGNDAVAGELGPTDNATTTWAESQRQVHQETGGQTGSQAEVRRDLSQ